MAGRQSFPGSRSVFDFESEENDFQGDVIALVTLQANERQGEKKKTG